MVEQPVAFETKLPDELSVPGTEIRVTLTEVFAQLDELERKV